MLSIVCTGQLDQELALQCPKEFSVSKQKKIYPIDTIYKIAYLLFGCEVDRDPASLLTHTMFLELIENKQNEYSFDTLLQKLPMVIEKAVVGMRKFNFFYGKYLFSKFFL